MKNVTLEEFYKTIYLKDIIITYDSDCLCFNALFKTANVYDDEIYSVDGSHFEVNPEGVSRLFYDEDADNYLILFKNGTKCHVEIV